jgi:hypothetical protein
MSTREDRASVTPNEASEPNESTSSDRRGFLRQVVGAGAGSAALSALMSAAGSQKADAALPAAGQRTVRNTAYEIRVVPNQPNIAQQIITVKVSGNPASQQTTTVLGGLASFTLPLDGSDGGDPLDTSRVAIQAVWWTPRSGLTNLTAFNHIAVGTNAAGTALVLEVEVVPGLSPALTIDTFVLHDPA